MKKLLTLTVILLALGTVGQAWAVLGWAGNAWPTDGSNQVPTGPLNVYAQVWKDGVTDAAGQGADIHAELYYAPSSNGVFVLAPPMTYNGDIGNNDEYVGQIPQSALIPGGYVDVQIVIHDDTDGTWLFAAGDAPSYTIRYNVTDVLPNDVEVGFRLCANGIESTGDVCVIGSDPALGSWSAGVVMNDDGGGSYGVTVIIPAGSNPTLEYKYQKDGCTTWESTPNRVITLPTDGTAFYVIPAADTWENQALDCNPVATEVDTWDGLKSRYR